MAVVQPSSSQGVEARSNRVKNWRPAFLGLALVGAGLVGAMSARTHAEYRAVETRSPSVVALVDMVKIFEESAELKARNQAIKEEKDQRDARLKELAQQIDAKKREEAELAGSATATATQRINLKTEIATLSATAQVLKEAGDALTSVQSGAAMRAVYLHVSAAVGAIMNEQGIHMVLLDDRSIDLPEQATYGEINGLIARKQIVAASSTLDITADVITRLNNDYAANPTAPVPGGTSTPKPRKH